MLIDKEFFSLPKTGAWKTVAPIEESRKLLNNKAFEVSHDLGSNPLFSLEELRLVARSAATRPGDLFFDAGDIKINDKWGDVPAPNLTPDEVIDRIENVGAWMILKHTEIDPRYAKVLSDFADFVRTVAGPEQAKWLQSPEMLVIITSPNRMTSFHFDAEVNFLVQIRGSKSLWVCDPLDRETVTEAEIEKYYAGNITAGTYKPGVEDRATRFDMKPGDAVHIPPHGAHWVKNDDNVSVSLSLNFERPRWMGPDIYRANHMLRRFGMKPRPPGQSGVADSLKATAVSAARAAAQVKRSLASK